MTESSGLLTLQRIVAERDGLRAKLTAAEQERDRLRSDLALAKAGIKMANGREDRLREALGAKADRISAPYRKEIDRLRERVRELTGALTDVLKAMRLWGSWEDGIPEAGDGAHGSVGSAFDRGCDAVGLDWSSTNPFPKSALPPSPTTDPCGDCPGGCFGVQDPAACSSSVKPPSPAPESCPKCDRVRCRCADDGEPAPEATEKEGR